MNEPVVIELAGGPMDGQRATFEAGAQLPTEIEQVVRYAVTQAAEQLKAHPAGEPVRIPIVVYRRDPQCRKTVDGAHVYTYRGIRS